MGRDRKFSCFFCLSQLTSTAENEPVSLKQMLRLLNVNWKEFVGNAGSDPGGGGLHFKEGKLSTRLCHGCSYAVGNFTSLCEELEVIQALVNDSAEKLVSLIALAPAQAQVQNLNEEDSSVALKKKAREQCLKLLAACTNSQVLLKRLEAKANMFPKSSTLGARLIRVGHNGIEQQNSELGEMAEVTEFEDITSNTKQVEQDPRPTTTFQLEETGRETEVEMGAGRSGVMFNCTICSVPFLTQKSLTMHMNSRHQAHENPYFDKRNAAVDYCPNCRKSVTKTGLYKHIKYYCSALQNTMGTVAKNQVTQGLNSGSFVTWTTTGTTQTGHCTICQKSFTRSHTLKCHRIRVHPEQFFLSSKLPNISTKQFKAFCLNLLNREKAQLSGVQNEHGKISYTCRYCPHKFSRLFGSFTHLVTRHHEILKKKLELLQQPQQRNFRSKEIPGKKKFYGSKLAKKYMTLQSRNNIFVGGVKVEVDDDSDMILVKEEVESESPSNSNPHPSTTTTEHINTQSGSVGTEAEDTDKHIAEPSVNITTMTATDKSSNGKVVLKCQYCQSPFIFRSSLVRHMRLKHPGKKISVLSRSSQAALTCKICNFECLNKSGLTVHIRSKHPERPVVEPVKMVPTTGPTFTCPHCQLAFISAIGMKEHIRKRRCSKLKDNNYVMENFSSPEVPIPIDLVQEEEEEHKVDASLIMDAMFSCNYCSQGFNSITGLLSHTRMEHSSTFPTSPSGT